MEDKNTDDKQITPEEIADMAANKALEKIQLQIGKSVVKGVLWTLGAASLYILYWLNAHGVSPLNK